ncbi:heme-binding protein [Aristophania vespae]|uniref:Heme-binding protein n=1 Tax=Aristophania vespae TaxID=2697033 RepID=A0A6P1NL34_9PROT|nr:heme-binding protein [Aristophania vespae]QHI95581.1 heme-binding protein [Aristophania vespae]UMM63246.1 hypothetical protein DM15PD_02040 [Aristophania vespae]
MKKTALALIFAASSFGSAYAASGVVNIPSIEANIANKLVAEAVNACAAKHLAVTATVVNAAGQRVAMLSGNGAPIDTASISYRKAYTIYSWGTAKHKNTTSELLAAKLVGPEDGSLTTVAGILVLPGGVILKSNGHTIGGLGVSGAPDGMDDEGCAKAAVEKYKSQF